MPRCPPGTRKNRKTGECEPFSGSDKRTRKKDATQDGQVYQLVPYYSKDRIRAWDNMLRDKLIDIHGHIYLPLTSKNETRKRFNIHDIQSYLTKEQNHAHSVFRNKYHEAMDDMKGVLREFNQSHKMQNISMRAYKKAFQYLKVHIDVKKERLKYFQSVQTEEDDLGVYREALSGEGLRNTLKIWKKEIEQLENELQLSDDYTEFLYHIVEEKRKENVELIPWNYNTIQILNKKIEHYIRMANSRYKRKMSFETDIMGSKRS